MEENCWLKANFVVLSCLEEGKRDGKRGKKTN